MVLHGDVVVMFLIVHSHKMCLNANLQNSQTSKNHNHLPLELM